MGDSMHIKSPSWMTIFFFHSLPGLNFIPFLEWQGDGEVYFWMALQAYKLCFTSLTPTTLSLMLVVFAE